MCHWTRLEDVNEQISGYNNRKEAYIKARLEKAKF